MKKLNIKNIIFIFSFSLIFISVIVTFLMSFVSAYDTNSERTYVDFSEGWTNDNSEEVDLDSLTESCRIHKGVPMLTSDETLSFNARNLNVDVYIDDLCVFRTRETNNNLLKAFYGKTAGSVFAEIPILKEYSGKTIYIDVNNPYANGKSCNIVNMFIGDGSQIIKHHASVQLGSFCFSIIIMFLGLICIILYIPMVKSNIVADRSMLYLGITAFTFGMCLITDCKLLHVIIGHESLYYTVSQIFMIHIPVPLLFFFEKIHGNLNNKIVIAISAANIIDFIVVFVLNCMNIMDYHDNAFAILSIIAFTIIYIAVITITDFIKKGSVNLFHNIGVIFLTFCFILDLIMTRVNIFVETSFFTKFGIAGFTCMECTQVLWNHIESYQQGLKAQLVSRLAYHDGLTDMLNRTSFIEEMDSLETENHSDILIAMFDVNNLKYVNDNFGHTYGDELIINVADSIRHAFEHMGKCFRIGGDEFVLIAKCKNAETVFNESKNKMDAEIEELDKSSRYPVSVAVGYAITDSGNYKLKSLLDEADEKMYENKKIMKAKITMSSAS